MASLERRGRLFRVAFRLGENKFHVSLKTIDAKEAEACLVRVEENLRLVERGRLEIPVDADVGIFLLSDGKLKKPPEFQKSPTLGGLFDLYRETFTRGVKESNTEKTERVHLKHLERILGVRTTLNQISQTRVQGYVNSRMSEKYRGNTLNPVTVKKELATFKFVWNWGHRFGTVSTSFPGDRIVFPKGKQKEPFRTYEQIEKMISRGGLSKRQIRELWEGLFLYPQQVAEVLELVRQNAIADWLYPFLVTVAHTGARRSEMFRAQLDDFDFANRVVFVREKKKNREKDTFRTVDMTPTLERILKEYFAKSHPGGRYAFAHTAGRPIEDRESRTAFRQATRHSKWQIIRGFHTFRHSFASNLAAAGVDQRIIDEMMGHQTDEMQRRYRHLFPEKRRAALTSVYG